MKLYEYLEDAKKIINHRYGGKNAKDEDLVSNVATALMQSDVDFDGRGTIEGYRYSRAIYAAQIYFRNNKRKNKHVVADTDFTKEYLNYISIKHHNTLKLKEIVSELESLPENQSNAINLYFMEGFTLREIGSALGVSHEMARLYINAGIKTLKEKYGISN